MAVRQATRSDVLKAGIGPLVMIAMFLVPFSLFGETGRLVVLIILLGLMLYSVFYQVRLIKIQMEHRRIDKDPLAAWRDSQGK